MDLLIESIQEIKSIMFSKVQNIIDKLNIGKATLLINFSSSLWKFQNKWNLHTPMNIVKPGYSGPATLTELSSMFICPIQKWMFPHGNGASSYLALSWVSVEMAPKEVTVLWALSTYSVESPTDESELPYPWTDQKSMI